MNLSIIVAVDKNFGIGLNGELPWHLPEDLKHFKDITTAVDNPHKQNAVIMGRKTWESIPDKFRPLPGRINVVLSRGEKTDLPEGVIQVGDFRLISDRLERLDSIEKFFIIGGAEIFRLAMESGLCKEIYLTRIDREFSCNTFFPQFDILKYDSRPLGSGKSGKTDYSFQLLTPKSE